MNKLEWYNISILDNIVPKNAKSIFNSNTPLSTPQGKTRKLRRNERGSKEEDWRTTENPNCRTKLSRNQVPGNPRAFKYFGTIAKANYVADVRTYLQVWL